jgi:hypothetical protein
MPRSLAKLYETLDRLNLAQQQEVAQWLQHQIQQQQQSLKQANIPVKSGREVVEQQGSYRLELVKCGKQACRCATGKLHGPYWYKYWREGEKVRCEYIGKRLPDNTNL